MSVGAIVTGLGIISPIALGVERFRESLLAGESAVRSSDGPTSAAARVDEIPARDYHAPALLRRMDRLSKMINVAGAMAAEDAGLVRRGGEGVPLVPAGDEVDADAVAVVAGSALGNLAESAQFLERVFRKGPALANPMLFPNLVMNAAASQLAMAFGWRGPNLTVCEGEISGETALERALSLIENERAAAVVVVAGDELSAILFRALVDLRMLSPRGDGRAWSSPFDRGANGAVPGEGAAALVLEPERRARRHPPRPRVRLDRVRRFHVGPAPAHAWPQAVRAVPFDSGPDLVVTSADSTPERDRLELALLADVIAAEVPVTSIKGATGEYGASGLANVLVAALALRDGCAPGLARLEQPRVAAASLRREAWQRSFRRAAVLGTARGGGAALAELSVAD